MWFFGKKQEPMIAHANKRSLAAAVTAGALYTAYSAVLAFSPAMCLRLLAPMVHLTNVELYIPDFSFTVTNFVVGFAEVVIISYGTIFIFGALYSFFTK